MLGRPRRNLPPVVIDERLFRSILAAAPGDSFVRRRNRALLHVLWYCGLRVSEALALRGSDVAFDSRTVRVRRGKGGKSRLVSLPDPCAGVLREFADRAGGSGLVFVNRDGGPVLASYVRAWMGRMARRVGVERLHAHGARHGHTLDLVQKGVPLHFIRDELGHANISTTDRYIARLDPKARVEAVVGAYR